MTEELENGCLWIGWQPTDYLICEGFEDALPQLYQQDSIIFEYNQSKQDRSKKSCTIFSAIWAISDLFNYEFPLSEIKEIDERSYSLWRFPNSWWWVQSAVKLVADRWNEHHAELWKVAYYKIDTTNNELVDKILDKGYNIMTNLNWNTKYSLDYLKDAKVDETEFWSSTYGHAINLVTINLKKIDGVVCVKDNYKWRVTNNWKLDCNIYSLLHYPREISVFGTNGYIYTKVAEDALEEVKRLNEIKTECYTLIEHLWTLWHLVNDTNFQGILHYTAEKLRWKIKDADEQLSKYM